MAREGRNFDPNAELVDPLDYRVLGFLKEQGTLFAGAYPDANTAKQISTEEFGGQIPTTMLGPRLNALIHHKLVVGLKGIGTAGSQMYQRTAEGKRVFEEWQAKQVKS